jgi:hypothetical protein
MLISTGSVACGKSINTWYGKHRARGHVASNIHITGGTLFTTEADTPQLVDHDAIAAHPVPRELFKSVDGDIEGTLEVTASGTHVLTVYASDPANGNAGADFVSILVR